VHVHIIINKVPNKFTLPRSNLAMKFTLMFILRLNGNRDGPPTCTHKNHTTCQQDVFATCLQQVCQQVAAMLLFYQVATRLSLITCWQIVELQDDNKLLEQLVRCQLIVNKLEINSIRAHLLTSCWNSIAYKLAAGLLQLVCLYVCRQYIALCSRISLVSNHKSPEKVFYFKKNPYN
jgi:hypothetical protein